MGREQWLHLAGAGLAALEQSVSVGHRRSTAVGTTGAGTTSSVMRRRAVSFQLRRSVAAPVSSAPQTTAPTARIAAAHRNATV
jgi:hypothetical protein